MMSPTGRVAVDLGDDARALVRVPLDLLPVLLGQVAARLQHVVRQDELADVVEQAGGVHQLLVLRREAAARRQLTRVARDRGAVARGHPVAEVERAEQRAEQRDLEPGELLGPQLELVGPLLREQELAHQVLEGQQHDREQRHGRQPELLVGEDHREREDGRGELGGQDREERAADPGDQARALDVDV